MCKLDGTCLCWRQFEGSDCSRLKCTEDCGERGLCNGKTGKCMCKKEWTGDNCKVPICAPSNCNGNGNCQIESKKCACSPGFTGNQCQFKICTKKCRNGGKCKEGECICPKQWEGELCQDVAKPEIKKIGNETENTVDIEYEAKPNITGHEISCIPNSDFPEANAVYMSLGPNKTQVTINDLQAGTAYTIHLYSRIVDQLSKPAIDNFRTKE